MFCPLENTNKVLTNLFVEFYLVVMYFYYLKKCLLTCLIFIICVYFPFILEIKQFKFQVDRWTIEWLLTYS